MPKTPDPVRVLQGRRDYYRRASSYDAARIRELDRELRFLLLEQSLSKALSAKPPLSAEQIERLVVLLRGAPTDV